MKIFSLIAAVFAVLFLSGCGEDASARKIRVGISIPSADHGWTGGVVWHAQQAKKAIEAENPDVEVIVSTARDAAEQVDKVENLLAMNISALAILPHEPGPLTGICKDAKGKGVYLVVVDRGLEEDVADVSIAGDNAGFGKAGAQALVEKLGGKGDILIMEGSPCVVNSDRVNGFRSVMEKHPGIRILDSQTAGWDTEKALKLMENYLQKHPKIAAVWTGDDDVLLGALKAYEESGRKDLKYLIGGGGSKHVVKMVLDRNPLIPFDVTYPPRMIETGARYAVAGALKKPLTTGKKVVIPAEIITPENASQFYFPESIY